ncbi:MAG: polyphosphate kinase 2 [Bowdeniella nasicola]|nr:polyphosphate kinase 2 [Bowdeniella nasicola]
MCSKKRRNDLAPPKLNTAAYEKKLRELQAELVELQQWVIENGERICILFEGRDAAGKGSAIKRVTQYLNPRHARVVALPAPTERERTQWYFQRYIAHLPAAGEIVLFDRSWYNRAGVEHVMGFCTPEEYHRFLRQAPDFERMLVDDGIRVLKYWFSVSQQEQHARFRSRSNDPMRRWKLSPMDAESITRFEDYARAKDAMFAATDTPWARWYTVESEDKKRSRLNVMNDILTRIPWSRIEPQPIEIPDFEPADDHLHRLDRSNYEYVDDICSPLERHAVREAKRQRRAEKEARRAREGEARGTEGSQD